MRTTQRQEGSLLHCFITVSQCRAENPFPGNQESLRRSGLTPWILLFHTPCPSKKECESRTDERHEQDYHFSQRAHADRLGLEV